MPANIRTDRQGAVAIITLDRPEALNAWHRPMREELMEVLRALEADAAIGGLVLTGAGELAFSAPYNAPIAFPSPGATWRLAKAGRPVACA